MRHAGTGGVERPVGEQEAAPKTCASKELGKLEHHSTQRRAREREERALARRTLGYLQGRTRRLALHGREKRWPAEKRRGQGKI